MKVPGKVNGISHCHSLQYLLNVSEMETWVEEKLPLVSSRDYGSNEEATFGLIRKHQVLCPEHLHLGDSGPGGGLQHSKEYKETENPVLSSLSPPATHPLPDSPSSLNTCCQCSPVL